MEPAEPKDIVQHISSLDYQLGKAKVNKKI